jgi:signal transduction histidine kinase
MKHKSRKLKNFLLKPRTQIYYGFLVFTVVLVGLAYVQGTLFFSVTDIVMQLVGQLNLDKELTSEIEYSLNRTWVVFSVAFFATWMFSILVGIYVTHRFLGPAVRIKSLISSLRKGDYSSREKLRKNDELSDVMEELNSLASDLERRHGLKVEP